jgi:hypothetical protein
VEIAKAGFAFVIFPEEARPLMGKAFKIVENLSLKTTISRPVYGV